MDSLNASPESIAWMHSLNRRYFGCLPPQNRTYGDVQHKSGKLSIRSIFGDAFQALRSFKSMTFWGLIVDSLDFLKIFSKYRQKQFWLILAHVKKYTEFNCDIHLAWNLQNQWVFDKILLTCFDVFLFLGSARRAEPFKFPLNLRLCTLGFLRIYSFL